MSKAEFPTTDKQPVTGAPNLPHLETTQRGLDRAREALARAQLNHEQAQRLHEENLRQALAQEKEKLRLALIELHGAEVAQAIADIEAQESEVIAKAELALEGDLGTLND